MNTKDSAKQALAVLIGTDEPCVGKAVEITMSLTFGNEREVRCTVKPDGLEIRKAVSLYDFDVVILFINTMMLIGSVGNKFEQTVELIQELKKTTRAAVIVGTTYHPKGFLTQAEQAGADGLIELPYTLAAMKETIQNAFEGLRLKAEAEAKAALIKQKRDALHPRVVLLDDESSVLELLSRIVWGCWRHATIVACTDSHAALVELQRTPPELFLTDLVHGGIDGCEMLERLAALEVKYPIVVLSGNLPVREVEARRAAGLKLRVSYWPKPVDVEELAEHLRGLLE